MKKQNKKTTKNKETKERKKKTTKIQSYTVVTISERGMHHQFESRYSSRFEIIDPVDIPVYKSVKCFSILRNFSWVP